MGEAIGPEAYVRQQKAIMTRDDVTDKLRHICTPSMVITGKDDKILPISDSYNMFGLLRKSKLVAYSSCGHLSTLESDSIYDDVSNFIG
jgi:pimeloyl-ACP methyl ester carboxylesterase